MMSMTISSHILDKYIIYDILIYSNLRILTVVGKPVEFGVNLSFEGLLGCPHPSANLIGEFQAC